MTTIIPPNRSQVLIEATKRPTQRAAAFFEDVADTIETLTSGSAIADAGSLTITWTTHEPTASTAQTIADGSSITAAETAQAIANLNAQVEKLKTTINEIISALETTGVIP